MKAFTVDIAGPERHDGEASYVYVTEANDATHAGEIVTAHFKKEQDTEDVVLVDVKEGVPPPNCGFAWNDLRPKDPSYELYAGLVAGTHILVMNASTDELLAITKAEWDRWKAMAKRDHNAGRRDGDWQMGDDLLDAISTAAKNNVVTIPRYISVGTNDTGWVVGDEDVVHGPGALESMSEDPGDERVWYRQIHPTSWVAYRGPRQAIAEETSEVALRRKLKDMGIEDYQHQPLRIARFGPMPTQ